MTYFNDLHTYLHQSSLLIQAYPNTRVTTKYSLPRRPNPKSNSKRSQKAQAQIDIATTTVSATADDNAANTTTGNAGRIKREPAASLTLKTYHPDSGICLKYRTDKAAEVGRLISGLGRLAKGEVIEMPSQGVSAGAGINIGGGEVLAADRMEVDGGLPAATADGQGQAKTASQMTAGGQQQQGGGGGKKKKKGKK